MTEITIDLSKMTIGEYDAIFADDGKADERAKSLIAKCCGLSLDEFGKLPMPEGAKLRARFWKLCKDVTVEDPNSESAST